MPRTLTLAFFSTLGACYQAHERPDAFDGSLDSGTDSRTDAAAEIDAWSAPDAALWDGGPCRTWDVTFDGHCTPMIEALCQARANLAALGRYAHSGCVNLGDGIHQAAQSYCVPGDYCPDGPNTPSCRCTPTRSCAGAPDYVCVSETLDGPRDCVRACTPR